MLPPPAPIVCTSTIGTRKGYRPSRPSHPVSMRPPRTSATSKLVPPMSTVTTSRNPAASPATWPATTPAAGPDSTVPTGRSTDARAEVIPPLDCMIWRGQPKPLASSSRPRSSTYDVMTGRRYASNAVTTSRSYSRNWGSTVEESETSSPGKCWRISAAVRCSWAGLRKENR